MDGTGFNLSPCKAGEVIRLSPLVRRITANNPGALTGPGTNTYLVGTHEIAVVDPGPADAGHIEAILRAGAGNIRWIVVTHTHDDHSPAAAPLAAATGATLIGALYPDDGYQDTTFHPGKVISHGEQLNAAGFTLEAIHTPGHVGNHYCYLLREERMLFTGDHIMEGSTVVIIPPSGNMAAYIKSLELLNSYSLACLAPGHGKLVMQPHEYVNYLVNHRLKREQKVVNGLSRAGQASIKQLVPVVYDDVDVSLHGIAAISLWAHLLKLEQEGRAHCSRHPGVVMEDEVWSGH